MVDLRIAVAQLNTVVGDLDGNVARILTALARAEAEGAELCAFPELAVTGYPPEDLLLKPGFVLDNERALGEIAAATGRCAAVVGFVERVPARTEPLGPTLELANAAALCAAGRIVGVYRKRELPNYGVFDERRWFTAGQGPFTLHRLGGALVGVSICEDVWVDGGPVARQGWAGADLVVNINASPYSVGRPAERRRLLRQRAVEAGAAIVYVNQTGGQDELVFDGASFVVDRGGSVLAGGLQFEEDLFLVDLALGRHPGGPPAQPDTGAVTVTEVPRSRCGATTRPASPAGGPPARLATGPPAPLAEDAEIYAALVVGTRDYLVKNGFGDVVVGLSGGIDSSLVVTVAVDAIGADHVHALSMPSRYSSEGSVTDAEGLADRLGVDLHRVPIEDAHLVLSKMVEPVLGGPPSGLADENLQSRLRGILLMTLSNARGWIVLTTGNKSEMATGYSTLYGDSVGGFAVIKDLSKTLVYRMCRYRNGLAEAQGAVPPIPRSVIDKPPSAELRPDQRDDQSLPPYDVLDPVLAAYVEQDATAPELVATGFPPEVVDQVVRLVDGAEYKRRQMPPGVRITRKAFGRDRRMPITNRYRPHRSAPGAHAAGDTPPGPASPPTGAPSADPA